MLADAGWTRDVADHDSVGGVGVLAEALLVAAVLFVAFSVALACAAVEVARRRDAGDRPER